MQPKERFILFTLGAVQFTHLMDFMIVMPLSPTIMRVLGISPDQFGLVVGSYAIAAGFFGLLGAFFLDRFDRRKALLVSYGCFALATFGCSLANTYAFFLITRMIAGAFGGLIVTLLLSIISDLIPYERRALAIGKVMMAFSLSSLIGIPIGLYLADAYSWHATFIFLGCLSLLAFAMVYFYIPSFTAHIKSLQRCSDGFLEVRTILRDSNHLKAYAVIFLLTIGQFTVIPFMSAYLVANGKFEEPDLKYIYLLGGFATLITTPLIGKLADLWGKLRIFTILIFLSVVFIYSLTHMGEVSLWVALSITTLFFVFMGGRTIPATTMISAAAHSDIRGSFLSLNTAVRQLSVGMASFLGGNLLLKADSGHLLNYDMVGWISIGFSLLSLYLARTLKVRS